MYSSGRLDEALREYQSIPLTDASTYYNRGTLELQMANASMAVAYLEKAHALAASDGDVAHNLAIARQTLGRQVGGVERLDAGADWADQVASIPALSWVIATLGLLAAISLIASILGSQVAAAGNWAALVLGLATAGLWGAQALSAAHPAAVAIESMRVRSGPGDHYLDLGRVDPGFKVRPTGMSQPARDKSNWLQVRFSSDGVGWVKASGLLTL